jgi:phosphoribosyl-dephospho-CoA transferase
MMVSQLPPVDRAGFEELIRVLQQTRELKAKALALGEAPVGLGRLWLGGLETR